MTDDLYCSTDGCGNFENNISKILSDISTLQNKDLDQDARLEALELLDIAEVITKSNNALLVANAIDAKATLALSTASIADGKVDGAISDAANAVLTAGDALTDSATALNKAIEAYNAAVRAVRVAGYADANAMNAFSASSTAVSDAAAAVITANAADGKADIAVYDSNVAAAKVNKAIITDAQTLTTGQKAQARANIDAMGLTGNEVISGNKAFINPITVREKSFIPDDLQEYAVNYQELFSVFAGSIAAYTYHNDLTITIIPRYPPVIGDGAFQGCTNLTTGRFNLIKLIGDYAFYGCRSLTGNLAFERCYSIGYRGFQECNLHSVSFTMKVTLIGDLCFANNVNLTTFVLRGNEVTPLSAIRVFDSTPIANGTGFIYVPDALVDAYLIATNWSVYASQIKKISELNE